MCLPHPLTASCQHMPVQGVVADVGETALKPLDRHWAGAHIDVALHVVSVPLQGQVSHGERGEGQESVLHVPDQGATVHGVAGMSVLSVVLYGSMCCISCLVSAPL